MTSKHKAKHARREERIRELIASGSTRHIALRILRGCNRYDKAKNLTNDLDLDFVEQKIQNPCSYCGDTETRRNLDRIDNSQAHTKINVVTSCHRCNFTRNSMPYTAWIVVAEGMKKARELGLFGRWSPPLCHIA